MPYYMYQAAYTPEAWAALVKNPSDLRERNKKLVEALGGKFIDAWISFGEYDVVAIFEFPGNVHMAAAAITAIAGGAGKAAKTTPLMTVEEGLEAMKTAGKLVYTAPGG